MIHLTIPPTFCLQLLVFFKEKYFHTHPINHYQIHRDKITVRSQITQQQKNAKIQQHNINHADILSPAANEVTVPVSRSDKTCNTTIKHTQHASSILPPILWHCQRFMHQKDRKGKEATLVWSRSPVVQEERTKQWVGNFPWLGISSRSFVQCFDTDGWVTGGHLAHEICANVHWNK